LAFLKNERFPKSFMTKYTQFETINEMVEKSREEFEVAVLEGIYQILEILQLNIQTLNTMMDAVRILAESHGYEFPEEGRA